MDNVIIIIMRDKKTTTKVVAYENIQFLVESVVEYQRVGHANSVGFHGMLCSIVVISDLGCGWMIAGERRVG